MHRLTGKTCIVTGAARGIGRAIAARFRQEGGEVVVTDVDEAAGVVTASEIGARFIRLDVGREEDWLHLADAVPAADVVVNNAGITGFEKGPVPHDPEHARLEDWRAVHRVNLDGTFLGCRYAIRAMKARGQGSIVQGSIVKGSIINISSRSGLVGIPAAAAYASSKAAIRNHTKTVALYCAQQGWAIRCNAIHPAAILTPIWEPMLGEGPGRAARRAALVADTPLKRFGTPEEVAAVAAMLASDEAACMTGAELNLDGGIAGGVGGEPGIAIGSAVAAFGETALTMQGMPDPEVALMISRESVARQTHTD
ncbi:SDR family oxidoreductase [Methylobacterium sp. 17Sr1-1]|uniref:SDR family oxidoreductase n=1 Tax=Methylobacterium sp. 17Sr1-1 TaxID=2202826 RepID=UPI000D6F16A4|nr:SDR family oxidoreductase [Methylobacterium sp. 17Sr1-1]AWN54192.1 short-chain dehydrogenase [Methylobacterium sp. 17Sr1-1]